MGIPGYVHCVGPDFDPAPQASLAEGLGHRLEGGGRADLWVEAAMIHHVVAVAAPRTCPETGRQVDLADPERVEVGGEPGHALEGEGRAELQAIGRETRPVEGRPDPLEELVRGCADAYPR